MTITGEVPTIFEFKFPMTEDNIKLKEDFISFFSKYGLTGIFTHQNSVRQPIKVDWAMARGVAYATGVGGYQRTLLQFQEILKLNQQSHEYERTMRQILLQSQGEFRVFMIKIKDAMEVIMNAPPNYNTRLWQAVYYTEEGMNMPTQIRNGRRV